MPIRVTCDECRGAFDAPDEDADGLAPCPNCGAACLVPVPGALPPLLAEAIEPDAPPAPPKPAARTALYVARNEWVQFGRGCVLLKWATALGYAGTISAFALALCVLVVGQGRAPQARPAPMSAELLLALVTVTVVLFAASGFAGALGRTLGRSVPERCGARAVLNACAILAWLRAVSLVLAVLLGFGATVDEHARADLASFLLVCALLGSVFGSIAELSALPALVAVGAAMPSADLRRAALGTTLVIQIGACVGVLAPLALMATAPLSGARGVEGYGPLAVPLLGGAIVFESVYALALFTIYDAGATAGASGGDRQR